MSKSKNAKNSKNHWDFLARLSRVTGVKKGFLARNWKAINGAFGGNLKNHHWSKKLEDEIKEVVHFLQVEQGITNPSNPIGEIMNQVGTSETSSGNTHSEWVVTSLDLRNAVEREEEYVTIQVKVPKSKAPSTIMALLCFPSVQNVSVSNENQ